MKKLCITCGKEFNAIARNFTCSKACSIERKRSRNSAWRMIPEVKLREKKRLSSQHCKDRRKIRYREYMAVPENAAKERLRKSSPEALARVREIMRRPENVKKARQRQATAEFRAMRKEYRKRVRAADIEKARQKGREYDRRYYNDPVTRRRDLDWAKRWRKTPTGKAACRKQHHRRRAVVAGAKPGAVNYDAVMAKTIGACGLCGGSIDWYLVWPHPKSASYDHIIPLSKGGGHDTANLQLAHLSCNCSKNNRTAAYK
jgi:hypothetical protein